jgi:hypothetical protein
MLRGARGTLAGRAGNSLDRALLLHGLLTQAGIPCRLVQGKLPEAAAQRALQQYLSVPPPKPEEGNSSLASTDLLKRAGVSDEIVRELHDRCEMRSAGFWKSVTAQTGERYTFLADVLKNAGLKAQSVQTIHQELLKALSTHYWVQRQDESKNWIDLDPSFSDAQPGKAAGEAGQPIASVPVDQRHQLELSLVYRSKSGSENKDEVVLKQTVDAADAPFNPIAFSVQSADANLPNPSAFDNKQKVELIRKMKRFQGIFRSGNMLTAGRPFDLEGNTYDVSPGGVIGNASGVGSAVGRGFGGFGGALGGGGAARKASTFVDVHVVLTLRSPGSAPITQTRVLVTASHPTPPLLNWEVFLEPQLTPTSLIEYQLLDYFARQRPFVEAILAPKANAWPSPDPWPFPVNAVSLALLRNGALNRTMERTGGVVALLDHPNLFLMTHRVTVNDAATSTEGRWGIDLVEMGLNFVPRDAANEQAALAAAIREGVAESTIEGTFLAAAFAGHGASSAAGRFDLSRVLGAAVKVVRPQDTGAIESLGWTQADVQSIAEHEPSDHLIVAGAALPGQSPAWWSISPSGTTVARAPGGFGEAETDYAELTINIACKVLCVLEGYELYKEKTTYAFTSFLICATMQGVGGGLEMAAEGAGFEGMGWIVGMVDLTFWCLRGMNKPRE